MKIKVGDIIPFICWCLCILCLVGSIIAIFLDRNKPVKEAKIEQAIIEELKLQATDHGEDGDEYVIYLFPASASYTEETDGKGKYYLALIIGSGTDDDGEWMFVEYYDGEIMTYNYRIVDFYRKLWVRE